MTNENNSHYHNFVPEIFRERNHYKNDKIMKKLSERGLFLAAGIGFSAVNCSAGVFMFADDACPVDAGGAEIHVSYEAANPADHGTLFDSGAGVEFAFGVVENLELDFSFDFSHCYESHHYAGTHKNRANFTGVSLGMKRLLLDPEKDFAGLAFVSSLSFAWAEADCSAAKSGEVSVGLNFEKHFLDDRLICVLSPAAAFSRERDYENSEWGNSQVYSLAAGTSFALVDGFRLGLEGVWEYEADSRRYLSNAFYAGPSAAFEAENFLFALGLGVRTFSVSESGSHDVRFSVKTEIAF